MSLPIAPLPVTDAAAVHDGLQRRIAELAEALAARDAFMAVAAHELRNPMTPILGQVDLLLAAVRAGRCPPEQVEQRLQRIQHSFNRYLKRTSVLLGVSRLTRGGFRPDLEAFDLAALLRDVVGEFVPAARHASVSISLAAPETLPVELDRVATELIIDNLVSNALKYGDRTPVQVTAEAAGGQVRIAVRDHGAGIRPVDRARMLDTFERAVVQSDGRSGFGIGLWLVARFVAAMQGTITVEETPAGDASVGNVSGGGLFIVTLPIRLKETQG